MTQKATSKPSKKQVDAVRTALLGDHPDEITRAWCVKRALADLDAAAQSAVAGTVVADAPDGLTKHWLGTLGGGDRGASARALAEAAAAIQTGRSFVTELLSGAAALVADEAVLMRAIQNLLIGRPYAPLFLDRGVALARTHAPDLAPVLEARAAFTARHAELLADLRDSAQEKKQKAATASLAKLAGADRAALVTWILSEPDINRDAKRWARLAGFVDPAVELEWLAWALNDGSGIYDEEEVELGKVAAAAGQAAIDRVSNMVVLAVEKGLINTMDHLAEAVPKAFATPRGFAALETALRSNDHRAKRICDSMRVLSTAGKAFDDAQAQRLVEILLECDPRKLEHELGRAFFYLQHPGSVPALARALDGPVTGELRKHLLDCAAHAGSDAAYDLLISRIFVEQTNLRDLTFSLTRGAIQARHAHLLAELDRRPSIHAAWLAVGPQVHWLHRPRAVLDIVERVLAWGKLPDSDDAKLAMIYGYAVKSGLELHRYDLGARALAALEVLPDARALEPTASANDERKPILKVEAKPLVAKLKSGELAVELAALRADSAAARAADKPIQADDERIGRLGGCKVAARIHDDPKTFEVWFYDAEGTYGFYDGYDVAPIDWWECQRDGDWGECKRLAAFAAGWRIEDRTLCLAPGAYREITRSGDKLFGKVFRSQPGISQHTFAMQLPSVERARAVFASFASHPMLGAKLSDDPFYISGKRDGGAVVREIVGTTTKGYVWRLGRELHNVEFKYQSKATMFATDAEAIAAFDAHEAELLQRGCFWWKLEVDGDRRPLSEMPLKKWIDGRYRSDSESAGWHLAALPAIRDAIALSGLSLDGIEAEVLPPASDAEIAAYEATLPTPMPDALREMWRMHAGASWRVGENGDRVLSPKEVLESRQRFRGKLRDLVKKMTPKNVDWWPYDHLDFLAVDRDDNPTIAFDNRQQSDSCYADCSPSGMSNASWWDSLGWMLAVGTNRTFVQTLEEKHPIIKKLRYAETAADVGKAKPKAKPAKKSAKTKK